MFETDSGINGGTTDSDNPRSPSIVTSNEVENELDVFGSDYRTFLHNQIKKVVEAEQFKRKLDKNDELTLGIDLCKNLLLEIGNRDERKAAQVMDLMIELKLELVQLKVWNSFDIKNRKFIIGKSKKWIVNGSRGS